MSGGLRFEPHRALRVTQFWYQGACAPNPPTVATRRSLRHSRSTGDHLFSGQRPEPGLLDRAQPIPEARPGARDESPASGADQARPPLSTNSPTAIAEANPPTTL